MIPEDTVIVRCTIPTDKLKPTAALNLFWEDDYYKQMPRILRMIESIKSEGVKFPLVIDNIDDDGTFNVRIGNQRLFVALHLGTKELKCLCNCKKGQKFIPEGDIVNSIEDVHDFFDHKVGRIGWLDTRIAVVAEDWQQWG